MDMRNAVTIMEGKFGRKARTRNNAENTGEDREGGREGGAQHQTPHNAHTHHCARTRTTLHVPLQSCRAQCSERMEREGETTRRGGEQRQSVSHIQQQM